MYAAPLKISVLQVHRGMAPLEVTLGKAGGCLIICGVFAEDRGWLAMSEESQGVETVSIEGGAKLFRAAGPLSIVK